MKVTAVVVSMTVAMSVVVADEDNGSATGSSSGSMASQSIDQVCSSSSEETIRTSLIAGVKPTTACAAVMPIQVTNISTAVAFLETLNSKDVLSKVCVPCGSLLERWAELPNCNATLVANHSSINVYDISFYFNDLCNTNVTSPPPITTSNRTFAPKTTTVAPTTSATPVPTSATAGALISIMSLALSAAAALIIL
ncbi:unnamed protein product [Aphanomyces euteiches]